MNREAALRDCRHVTNRSLRFVMRNLEKNFPNVRVVTTGQVGNILADLEADPTCDKRSILLLDIRENPEFEVSHISGAEFIDFTEPYSKQFRDAIAAIKKTRSNAKPNEKLSVFVYCAVGIRASLFTSGFQKYLKRKQRIDGSSVDPENARADGDDTLPYTELEFHVMEGCIYKWAFEGRPMVDKDGTETSIVHRCSKLWGLLLLDKEYRDSTPVPWII